MNVKLIFSAMAIVLTFVAFVPYIYSILRGVTKPHVFSWFIWGLTTFIVFFAQLNANGGAGAWPIGVSGIITLFIAVLAYKKRSDIHITRLDWAFLIAALSSLPLWFFTSDPLWAVIILTIVDLMGFGPTLRKGYFNPFAENIPFFIIIAIRNALALLALNSYSYTTVLFPLSVALACVLFIGIVLWRRKVLSRPI